MRCLLLTASWADTSWVRSTPSRLPHPEINRSGWGRGNVGPQIRKRIVKARRHYRYTNGRLRSEPNVRDGGMEGGRQSSPLLLRRASKKRWNALLAATVIKVKGKRVFYTGI